MPERILPTEQFAGRPRAVAGKKVLARWAIFSGISFLARRSEAMGTATLSASPKDSLTLLAGSVRSKNSADRFYRAPRMPAYSESGYRAFSTEAAC